MKDSKNTESKVWTLSNFIAAYGKEVGVADFLNSQTALPFQKLVCYPKGQGYPEAKYALMSKSVPYKTYEELWKAKDKKGGWDNLWVIDVTKEGSKYTNYLIIKYNKPKNVKMLTK